MPAAAVIPALRAYIKVVAFKTPVVEIAWSGVQEGGERGRRQEKRDAIRMLICAPREKEKEGGKERKRVHLCIQILNKLLSIWNLSLSRCMVGVRGISSASFSSPLPFWVPALSFVTIKKLECL